MHPAELASDGMLAECTMRRARRSGPGGQHRNKVETAVVWRHEPSGIAGEAAERRSQAENRRGRLAAAAGEPGLGLRTLRDPRDRSFAALARARCAAWPYPGESGTCDYPALLAEALDVLDALDTSRPLPPPGWVRPLRN